MNLTIEESGGSNSAEDRMAKNIKFNKSFQHLGMPQNTPQNRMASVSICDYFGKFGTLVSHWFTQVAALNGQSKTGTLSTWLLQILWVLSLQKFAPWRCF